MQTEEIILPQTNVDAHTECQHDEYELVYHRPETMVDTAMHYCPGCAHSLVHKLIMEVVEEMDIQNKTVGVAPVGCSVFAYDYMDIDMQEAAHGRACAVATALKRLMPDKYVFTYQGDGDLAAADVRVRIDAAGHDHAAMERIFLINLGARFRRDDAAVADEDIASLAIDPVDRVIDFAACELDEHFYVSKGGL